MRALRPLVALALLALSSSAGAYTVRWGDTLGALAQRFGVPVRTLLAVNQLHDPDRIRAGQVLMIPDGAPAPAPPSAPAAVHRVAAGETLGGIARRYGTTVARLAALNGIRDHNHIRAGAALRVGAAAPTWVCPVHGPVRFVSGFRDTRGRSRPHEGVDLAAPRGTPVVANVSGVVEHHPNRRGGLAYYLRADGGDTYYGAHLDSFVGPPGRVRLGQAIGRVGDTGNARGGITHLHFEHLPDGGAPVDPIRLLQRACVQADRAR